MSKGSAMALAQKDRTPSPQRRPKWASMSFDEENHQVLSFDGNGILLFLLVVCFS